MAKQAQDVIRCQYCEDEPALFHCVPCGDELCPRCKVFHLKSKVPSGHNIIRLSERLHPTNLVKMCEIHSSKAYEACCEDCQVPVCIMCIQEVHGKHAIKKIQELYEKLKSETEEKLSKMKAQWKPAIIQRIKYFKQGEKEIKTGHENIREKMKKQAQDFIDHIRAILKESLHESEEDEKKKLEEISQHKADAERFEQKLDQLIEKLETLTKSSHPADLLLYRKKNPDIFKGLKFPEKFNIAIPSFTVGHIKKSQNEHQFGQFNTGHIRHLKSRDDSLQPTQPTSFASKTLSSDKLHNLMPSFSAGRFNKSQNQQSSDDSLQPKQPTFSASNTLTTRNVLTHSVKISGTKNEKKRLYNVSCLDDRSAYISGNGPGILLTNSSGTQRDYISTETEPSGLAVMHDGSLIYSNYCDKAIYKLSLRKQKTKLIDTENDPRGLCCTRSGNILVCMGCSISARVVEYSSSGKKIQEFQIDQNGERLFIFPFFVCENVNDDICISDMTFKSKVVVLNKFGNLRFKYYGNVSSKTLKDEFQPYGVATDSLGHILIADRGNNAVHLISQDGDFLSYILTKDDGILQPKGVSVDTSDNLWLEDEENDCVKVYQYLMYL